MAAISNSSALIAKLERIVGKRHVLSGVRARRFERGYRTGSGPAAAVVRPGTLVEQWHVLCACIEAGHIVIAQAANTGLTGGSTPNGEYDRPVVIINTLRIDKIIPLSGGKQVLCLAGSTLHELERLLAPLGREPHSVIGSSCIGASVVGGVCNNSGGSLVARGPAYTQYALFAQVSENGEVQLRNHLGLALEGDPESMLSALDRGSFNASITHDSGSASAAKAYAEVVREVDASSPARFNANPNFLFEASGCAGRVMVFAVRLDTFPREHANTVSYVGTNDPDVLTEIRRRFLVESPVLPISAEYIHREASDFAARYGKDTVAAIRWLGTTRIPLLFRAKDFFERFARRLGASAGVSDRTLQAISRLMPSHLPRRISAFRDRYEHHLILNVGKGAAEFTSALLGELCPGGVSDTFVCTPAEAKTAMLHRFAVAGAAVRYRALHPDRVEDLVAIDVALRRNDRHWLERLPAALATQLVGKLYYGHFFCHVMHQDYLVKKGIDPVRFEHEVLALLKARGAEYPAEHNVGHLYAGQAALVEHYQSLDPGNVLNPGIGQTSRLRNWAA